MAQVIRKYLEGGKTKPTIVKIDGKDYNYDDIERNVWGNFEAHAKANNWDAETQNAVRDYLEYSLAGLKSGELSYGHNKMNNVSLEYETDGTFNTKGKGLFKRDITNDKRAGATLGTAYYNTLINNVMKEYKAPELKSISSSITLDVAKKIMDNNYGGSPEAMQEGWYKLTPLDRYAIFRQAISDLDYNANEYKDVDAFNIKKASLLQLLQNPYTDEGLSPEIEKAYYALGGYGLNNLINGEAKKEDGTEELKPKTIEEWRKDWRNEAIQNGIETEQGIADYIALKERTYNETQSLPGLLLKSLQEYDQFESASKSLDNYIKFSKENTYRKYKFNREPVNIGIEKMNKGDYYKFDNFSKSSIKNTTKNLTKQLREGKVNPFMWRGLIHYWVSNGLTPYQSEDKQRLVYIIPDSMDLDSETVAVVSNGNVMLASIHDFPFYAKLFNNKFRLLYKQQHGVDLPDDWWETYLKGKPGVTLLNTQEELQVQSNKNGGILKAQDGAAFFRAMAGSTNGDYDLQAWNIVTKNQQAKRLAEIDEATNLGVTVEELRKLKADLAIKDDKLNKAVKHGQSTTESFKDYDIAGLVGVAGDITETIGSITGGAFNPATILGGLTSLGAYTYADVKDPRVSKWGVAGNLIGNLLLSGAGLIPEIGATATAARLTKRALKYGPALIALAKDVPEMVEPVNKLVSGKTLTNDDWMAIANGIRAISTGTRMTHHAKNTLKYTTKGDTKYLVKTSEKGWQDVSKSEYDKLSGKKANELSEILSKERVEELGALDLRRNRLTPWKNENRKVLVREQLNPRRLKTYEEVKNDYGRVSRAYTNMVRDTLRMLNLGQTLRNNRFTRWLGNIGYKSNVSPEEFYKRTGLWGGKTSEGVPMFLNPESIKLKEKVQSDVIKGLDKMKTSELEGKLNSILDSMRKIPLGIGKSKAPTLIDMNKALATRAKNLLNGNRSELKAYVGKNGKVTLVVDKNLATIYDRNKLISINTPVVTEGGERLTLAEAFAKGKLVKYDPEFLKRGGSIFLNNVISKFQQGGTIVGNVSSDGKNWHDVIFSQFFNDLYEGLKSGKFTPDDINEMLKRHQQLWAHYDANKGAYVGYDNNVGNYLLDIINKYGFVNDKGINNGWINNRYTTVLNRRYNTDHKNADGSYAADNVYGGQTDDRRILGREGDFTPEQLTNYNNKLKDLGIEMYLAGEPGSNKPYYMLRKLGTSENSNNNLSTPNGTYTDPITGESLLYDPKTGQFVAVGNGNAQTKSKALNIGEDIVNYIKNINPADAIALGRALWGENVNNKAAELTKLMQTVLLDPLRETAILHGNYNAKMLALMLAGKINAAALKPISSDAGLNYAARLEAAQKATQALQLGNAEDSEMYWKTLQILNLVNNENAAQEVATGNENRSRTIAGYNNRLQVEAARLAANFEQIWQPFLSGVEKRYRDEDTLRRQAEIDNWKYKVTNEYEKKNDLIMQNYKTRLSQEAKNWNENNPKYKEYAGDFWNYFAKEVSPEYLRQIKDVSREMYDRLYEGLSQYYTYTPFQLKRTPELATPGIVYLNYGQRYKSGGTLSAAERQALKITSEINKNIRQAARETYKNIREDKREHRKAMALVSQLSADLIKKAVGIK